MSQEELECPDSASDLYLAASPDEVEAARPILTGDVFSGVTVPGLDGSGLAIVLTHLCSMRADGVNLAKRLFMARVSPSEEVPISKWQTGHFKVMPLPELLGEHYSARFDEMGLVESAALPTTGRVACMTPYGVNLLQQRFIWYLTRFLVPTHRLDEATGAVFEEADLQEEWVVATTERGEDVAESARAFHKWVRSIDDLGVSRQKQLEDPQRRAGLRRQMRSHLRD